jgi:hypothetical protein
MWGRFSRHIASAVGSTVGEDTHCVSGCNNRMGASRFRLYDCAGALNFNEMLLLNAPRPCNAIMCRHAATERRAARGVCAMPSAARALPDRAAVKKHPGGSNLG